jgi:O-antigen ligase
MLLLWLLVLVPPLVIFPTAKEAFRTPKLLVSEWLALAALLPLAWGLARAEVSWRGLWRDLWGRAAVRACLPLLVVASLGVFTSAHPAHFREAIVDLWIGAALLVGISLALPAERLEQLLGGLRWPAAALALFGILQYHGLWRPLLFSGAVTVDPRLAITATAGNPGDLGAYLVLPCLLLQWQLARASLGRGSGRPARPRLGHLLALGLCVYCVALTQTLAAIAAAGVGSLVLWALVMPRRRSFALLGGGLACALLLVALVPPLRMRAAAKLAQARQGDWNAVLTGRLDGWRAAAWMLREQPVAGVGQGAFRAEFVPAKVALLDRGVRFYSGPQQGMFANAHNELLEVGADLGVPGLFALGWGLWVLVGALRSAGAAQGWEEAALSRGAAVQGRAAAVRGLEAAAQGLEAVQGREAAALSRKVAVQGLETAALSRKAPASSRDGAASSRERAARGRAEAAPGEGPGERADGALAWAATAALGLLSLVLFPFRIALLAFPALLMLAWVLRRGDEARLAKFPAGPGGTAAAALANAERQRPSPAVWVVLAVLAAALTGQTLRLVDRREGGRLLHQAEVISGAIEAGRAPITLVFRNLEALRRAAALDPVEVGIPIARGTQYLLLPHPDAGAALDAFAAADRLEPRPATLILEGRALLAAGRRAEADRRFSLSLRLDPSLAPAVPPH